MLSFFQIIHIFFGLGLASAAKCNYNDSSVVDSDRSKYCSNGCCFKSINNVCCPTSGITLSKEVYYGMGGGGLVFILLVAGCCKYRCRSKESEGEETEANPQPAMPFTPYTIAPGAHPYGMTNNSVPGGYNAPMQNEHTGGYNAPMHNAHPGGYNAPMYNAHPRGYNASMHTAPVIKSKKSSSQSALKGGFNIVKKVAKASIKIGKHFNVMDDDDDDETECNHTFDTTE